MDYTGPVPVLDMSKLRGTSSERSAAVEAVGMVINHGISTDVLRGALDAATAFFDLPMDDRSALASKDHTLPVRYFTFSAVEDGEVKIRRHVLKKKTYPLEEWIGKWPSKPHQYREKMGKYAEEIRVLECELVGAITESLGLGRLYLTRHMERGMGMMTVNCYPPCASDAGGTFSCVAHTDYTLLTVLLESDGGLEELDPETGSWCAVRHNAGSLLVHVGDCLEVVSNGRYRAAVHPVAWGRGGGTRVSIASLPSLAMDKKVEIAEELVDAGHPAVYKHWCTMKEFLEFLSAGRNGRDFVESLKISGAA